MKTETSQKDRMFEEVAQGLSSAQKTLPSKYFYDKRGGELFERICTLPEYYPTRTEILILESSITEIVSDLGTCPILVEFGSGSSTKTRILLRHLREITSYIPIDICRDSLAKAKTELRKEFPNLKIVPICEDFCEKLELTRKTIHSENASQVAFLPGSTIGNFNPEEAISFMTRVATMVGLQGKFLIGVDTTQEVGTVERAYNDSLGVTGEFNLNILHHINRELEADFKTHLFRHHAFYNPCFNRIEMHLICTRNCEVSIRDQTFSFQRGESIHTENSYKYNVSEFIGLAQKSGFQFQKVWCDERKLFNVFLFEVPPIPCLDEAKN